MSLFEGRPRARRMAYDVSAVVGLGLGATQVGYASLAAEQPGWLTAALAVYAFLGAGLGLTARTNVNED